MSTCRLIKQAVSVFSSSTKESVKANGSHLRSVSGLMQRRLAEKKKTRPKRVSDEHVDLCCGIQMFKFKGLNFCPQIPSDRRTVSCKGNNPFHPLLAMEQAVLEYGGLSREI
ncbi:hypothetical protein RRG08_021186 [Elysia crispata]|uniref:Uncharacterized protein n=1 Tax=Elysia crispata TaxID=231223 RepID=A0AAE0YNX3_9GAST|nr:hypothetical protein RRG08_021186 [Elysia crispata]